MSVGKPGMRQGEVGIALRCLIEELQRSAGRRRPELVPVVDALEVVLVCFEIVSWSAIDLGGNSC